MNVNTEEIMKEIRGKAASRSYPEEVLSFSDIDVPKVVKEAEFSDEIFQDETVNINNYYEVHYGVVISGNPAARFFRKCMYAIARAFQKNLVAEINRFNSSLVRWANELTKLNIPGKIIAFDSEFDDVDERATVIENDVDEAKSDIAMMRIGWEKEKKAKEEYTKNLEKRISALEKQVEELEKKLTEK